MAGTGYRCPFTAWRRRLSFERRDIERKILAILKVLQGLQEPAGGRVVAQKLREYGVVLSERAVRYHLKIMDERGLTQLVGNRDGRILTDKGKNEIKNALVKDKVGLSITKIELLAFRTTFDYESRKGLVPLNVSFFPENEFKRALPFIRKAIENKLCVSQLVVVASGGQKIGDLVVPDKMIGLGTVCSIVINGTLLKAGVPMDSRFSGTLQLIDWVPVRFTEIIHYNGCSLDPTEIFIRAGMTSVCDVLATGNGEVLANFREVPSICMPVVDRVLGGLKDAGINGVIRKGSPSESVCEVAVDQNMIGMVLVGGLNPVAAAQEMGISADNHSMSTVTEYSRLVPFTEIYR
jgi:repressor of nif and glnA expression